jgi:hypothetical protein
MERKQPSILSARSRQRRTWHKTGVLQRFVTVCDGSDELFRIDCDGIVACGRAASGANGLDLMHGLR